eukprot:TRINITY_DN2559_c0_g1_i1.p1 TRINITY_DN2559_c0_g1~~TRINITY_DN2559_c0_g1_i1.p1  ORF type:complete len:249 (-),score=84.22 TRINITY_DN2559_c0_g1_i1:239-985(-)
MASTTLADGRTVVKFEDEAAMSAQLVAEVTETAKAAIAAKGSFSLCIPAGSVVSALKNLDPAAVDWSKVNVFFTGERLGQNKSYSAALDSFCTKCKIKNVFFPLIRPLFSGGEPLPQFAVDESAAAYTALLKAHPAIDNSGPMPSFDMLLLGVGEDGHCGSLHPKSKEIKATGSGTVTFGICNPTKNQIAISMDVMTVAKKVILAACGAKKAEAVRRATTGDFEEFDCPAALVKAPTTLWYTDKASNP